MNHQNNLYIALLHYPVYNKTGAVVTTAVTNLDLHDISRIGKTYGVKCFYVITPLATQRDFVRRILSHWQDGYGAVYNPLRKEAFDIVAVRASLEEVRREIEQETGKDVSLISTSASKKARTDSYGRLRAKIKQGGRNYLILFGTGWGMADEVLQQSDFTLEPIKGPTTYNHLSVRSAVSIVMDRLMGQRSD